MASSKNDGTKLAKSTQNSGDEDMPNSLASFESMGIDLAASGLDSKDFVEERFGYAPYWNPAEGSDGILVTVLFRDESDPAFVRFLCRNENGKSIQCFSGAKDSQEAVTVNRGDEFVISDYHTLSKTINQYLDAGINPMIGIQPIDKVRTNKPGQFVWRWRGIVRTADKALLQSKRAASLSANNDKPAARPALKESRS